MGEGDDQAPPLGIILSQADLPDPLCGLEEEQLQRLVAQTLRRVGVPLAVEISLLVTNDDGLRVLNRDYRGRNEVTDVLSFPLLDVPLVQAPADELWLPSEVEVPAPEAVPGQPLALGDIALSHDAVQRQAQAAGHAAGWEFAYLVVHGVLHLVGYDDGTDAGYAAMVAHQEALLAHAGIAR